MPVPSSNLPVAEVLSALSEALTTRGVGVLQAPPGAGKTTLVPLALLDAPWLAGRRIVMLEPRRLAARAAAARMAALLGEQLGETVGHRVRFESTVGPRTRIEVVTEGILTRRLQRDPGLDGVGCVIFDEFHERSLHADLGLALCLELRAMREDLRLLAMSATLDGARVAALMGDAPVIASEGRQFPVEVVHLDRPPNARVEDVVARAGRRALAETRGDVLVFLPGEAEIRRTERQLEDAGAEVLPLYGALPRAAQDRALTPLPNRRKIVLATSIAETSLTIEGVHAVVDSGLSRRPRFDPRTGMTRLETMRVSRAAAEQRRGRAGRLAPGVCYRLWPAEEHRALVPFDPPEILAADLAPLALELALWGARDPLALAWLDPPPQAAYRQAQTLLRELGAIDAEGRATAHGRRIAEFGAHPRLGQMLLGGQAGTAAAVAAVLEERDVIKGPPGRRETDLRHRLSALDEGRAAALPAAHSLDPGALARAREARRRWLRQLGARDAAIDPDNAGATIVLAYPERLAQRRGARGQFRTRAGRGAALPSHDPLADAPFLAVATVDGGASEDRIVLAAPIDRAVIERLFGDQIERVEAVTWDEREQAVLARRQDRLDALVLSDAPLSAPSAELVQAAVLTGVRQLGLDVLPWTPALRNWQARLGFLRHRQPDAGWPDVDDAALLTRLEDWLAPFLGSITRRGDFARIDLDAALKSQLDWPRLRRLDELVPTHLTVPSGSRLPLDYGQGEVPVLAVRLQEMFGATETPTVAGEPVLLHLLSPAGRPAQVTRDLQGFWANSYAAVRADLRGRYPKHYWPDDPRNAMPTGRVRPRG
jgi:ATP-dependent helicase HrpB